MKCKIHWRRLPCTWFCRKLSSYHLLSARYSTYTSNSSVSCTDVGFLNTCCSLHPLPSDFKYLLSLQFPHLSFCHTTSIFYYLQRPSSKFLVVYCQIICSWYSNSYPVSKATFVSSCSGMARKVRFVIEVSNYKVVQFKKVASWVVRQELTPLSAMTTWSHMQKLPSYFQQDPCKQRREWGLCFSFVLVRLCCTLSSKPVYWEVPAAKPSFIYAVSWKRVRLDIDCGHSTFRQQRPRNTVLPSFYWAPNYL